MTRTPIRTSLEDKLIKRGRTKLRRDWDKAVRRLDGDLDGAVTAARTLLESTCKYILEGLEAGYDPKADLPDLYGQISKLLGIAPSVQLNRLHRQFFGSTHAIVQAVAELRNKAGDAHGKGREAISPSRPEAELAVNLAGALSSFLLCSMEGYLSATKRISANGDVILKFDKARVWRLVDHAENSPAHMKSWRERKPKPGLWLVGDSGIYLMSNGDPPLLRDGKTAKVADTNGMRRLTAHADGCDWMDDFDQWWPIHNAIAGGDDFAVTIPLRLFRRALELAESQIVIVWGKGQYAILADVEFETLAGRSPFELVA
jgi:hypothetical protein